ncbi:SET domain-containing protein [Rhodopseudomonas sp. BR0M22]|uniref:SET domain-containing protein n=1 Tax=Rhodopseudomonas sp. BR0M22 TaxID=2269369 RepID=UPI0013E0A63E|nr:SET domain-containing protein [Rhodopseudomonas sp. BR0M22]NEW93372.1 SET domain-containing protein [Rhodopseudomonas sp. BR0M22]
MPLLSNDHYRVGRSKTGLGLFALKPIKKGAKIIRYFGPLLDAHNKKHDGIENKYLFELNKRWTIDGSVRKNIARYINHACKPNAESDVNPRKKRVIIRAIKNIEPGEEINYDYGTDYFKAYLKPIGCKCASCEKKRKKKAAEAKAEKAKLKLKAERKAQAEADKAARKAAKAAGKAKPSKPEKVAKSKAPKAVKGKTTAKSKGTAKAAKTKVVTAKAAKTKAAKPAKTTSSRKTAAASKSKAA